MSRGPAVLRRQGRLQDAGAGDLHLVVHMREEVALDGPQRSGPIGVAPGTGPQRQVASEELVREDFDLLVRDVVREVPKILVRCAALHALAVRGAHQVVAEAAAPPGEPVGDLRCEVLRCKVLALGVLVLGVLGLEGIGCKDSGIARAEASEVRGMGYESGHRFFPSQQGAGVRG